MNSSQSQQPNFDQRKATPAEQQLLLEWAWGQVEAMADGTLDAAQSQRMQQAMALSPELQHAVKQSHRLLTDLDALSTPTPSSGLWRRLWVLPKRQHVASEKIPWWQHNRLGMVAAVMTVVVLAVPLVVYQQQASHARSEQLAQQQAMHDFQVAMLYVDKTARLSSRTTTQSLGGGIQHALSLSMNHWISDDLSFENGE
ncbi:MAG: hypothetical protein MI750_03310 [Xanthomonadales bacterium]|nr:hypothetical protein [Xanthomonadales bacterium]